MSVLTKPPRPVEWHCADCGKRHPRAGSPDHFWRCLSVKVAPMKGLSFQQVIAMAKEATSSGLIQAAGGSLLL